MANKAQKVTLGSVLKRRRQQLGMTQADVAKRVNCRPNYIGYLEAGARRPSPSLVTRLAKALDLSAQELFLLSNPIIRSVMEPEAPTRESVWQRFKDNKRLHTRHGITQAELGSLAAVAKLGPVGSERDFLFVLQAIRQALADG